MKFSNCTDVGRAATLADFDWTNFCGGSLRVSSTEIIWQWYEFEMRARRSRRPLPISKSGASHME